MKTAILFFALVFSSFLTFGQPPLGIVGPLDSCDFETPCHLVILDSATVGIWQIGQPHKIIFDSAYSPVNAIVTDTLLPYPINEDCFFEIDIKSNDLADNLRLSFKHKFDTDRLIDGGYVEVSYDDGQSWENINNSPFPLTYYSENLYTNADTLLNGEPGFSGSSNGWINSSIIWITPRAKGTEVNRRLRFHFISDSIETNKEGWMIDNLYLERLEDGIGIKAINNPSFKIYPNPAQNFLSIDFKDQSLKPKTITIYNLMGQVVKTINSYDSQNEKIDISKLNKDFYIIKVFEEDQYLGSCKWLKI